MTWIFNNTNGSVLAAILFHGMANSVGDLIWCCGSSAWHWYGVELLVVILIVIIFGARNLVRRRPEPAGGLAASPLS
jgi:prolipoprotein diacylglyceryltransferase